MMAYFTSNNGRCQRGFGTPVWRGSGIGSPLTQAEAVCKIRRESVYEEHEMGRLKRKNLMVEDEKVRELARLRGVSESEAVRQAVDHALAAEEVMAAIRELHARGG